MKQITLQIEGMKCSMCEDHICHDIRDALPQAKKVKASHFKNTASFVIEDDEDENKAVEKITKGGYKVLSVDSQPYEKKGFFSFLKK